VTKGGDWFAIKKGNVGDVLGNYALYSSESYNTASAPGGIQLEQALSLTVVAGSAVSATLGGLAMNGTLGGNTLSLFGKDLEGHETTLTGVVVGTLIGGVWEGNDGTNIWGGTFMASKGEPPEDPVGTYSVRKGEQYQSGAGDSPSGMEAGTLVISTWDGASASGNWDGVPFIGSVYENRVETTFTDPGGNTVHLKAIAKDGALIGLWETTGTGNRWGGSFFANKD
jgi:hypothetical protein